MVWACIEKRIIICGHQNDGDECVGGGEEWKIEAEVVG